MSTRTFDAIIVGGGQAGPPFAARLAAAGMQVALIERRHLGGTCVNTGCMPTKALVANAYAAHIASRAADYGVLIDAPIRIDFSKVMARARTVTANARGGLEAWIGGLDDVTLIRGLSPRSSRDSFDQSNAYEPRGQGSLRRTSP